MLVDKKLPNLRFTVCLNLRYTTLGLLAPGLSPLFPLWWHTVTYLVGE